MAHAGMLRRSGETTNRSVDLSSVIDTNADSQLHAGAELLAFTDALVERDDVRLGLERSRLAGIVGPSAAGRVAAVVANFEMMNRILDATGVPVPRGRHSVAADLGIDSTEFGREHGFA